MTTHAMNLSQSAEVDVFNKISGITRKYRGVNSFLGFRNPFKVEHYRLARPDGSLINNEQEQNSQLLLPNPRRVLIGEYNFLNDITNEGKNLILDVMFHDATQIASTSWYGSLISSAGYTALAAADTMASHGGWAEFTAYSQSNRVGWGPGAAASQAITNATPMTFDITSSGTVKGIFITSSNTKSGTSGKLWATGLFSADVPVSNGDQLKVTYTVAT